MKSSLVFALSLAAAGLVAQSAWADGDAAAGKTVFAKCAACHTAVEPKNKVGPSLMGIVGRPIATVEGYKYSEAMTSFGAGGKVWDEATLAQYLLSPKGVVPKTKMAFVGLKTPEDVANVIAYLKAPVK
ncbi:cytochrome c family protein [Rhizobium sp. RU20A]|uniref:c-type cytochrome n=1 Tax=Rhizobium sp. RU20A TaxID=1907412 RepID=UPI00122CAA98|nr:cytochrome c family protein [Rhizobium sp. RU20A]